MGTAHIYIKVKHCGKRLQNEIFFFLAGQDKYQLTEVCKVHCFKTSAFFYLSYLEGNEKFHGSDTYF